MIEKHGDKKKEKNCKIKKFFDLSRERFYCVMIKLLLASNKFHFNNQIIDWLAALTSWLHNGW